MSKKSKVIRRAVLLCIAVFGMVMVLKQQGLASWKENEDGRQYETEDGELAKGFVEIDGEKYYFNEDGYLITGKFFCDENQKYYYSDKQGVVKTGVIKYKKGFYIADEQGVIQTGFVEYENNRYYFDGAANMVTGWFKHEENWYYADHKGIIQTGFITLDGYRYYLNSDGTRVSDVVMEIDGVTYIFNKDGSVDENATTMYPVYKYLADFRKEGEFIMDSKVQACAILRASDLQNGYALSEDGTKELESLLKNRGVKCEGGYEFSYGGIADYGIEQLLNDMKKDMKLQEVLKEQDVSSVGLGTYELDSVYYYDIIFICK
ncbi:MAG: hypothetical protein K2L07_04435 [Lachnospiraceae bacterium]|nr:hypothetical protein [Lachnospiraceae bacterium]